MLMFFYFPMEILLKYHPGILLKVFIECGYMQDYAFGRTNLKFGYFMTESASKISELEKKNSKKTFIGVYFTPNLDWKDHTRKVTARANKILGSLEKAFVCRDSGLWKNLYMSLLRPHLEFDAQV